jgi:hypothetical protein
MVDHRLLFSNECLSKSGKKQCDKKRQKFSIFTPKNTKIINKGQLLDFWWIIS